MIHNDYTDRYIYDVTNRVPKKQRKQVHDELKQLIADMCDNDSSRVEEILLELGNPAEYAKKYKDKNTNLIGYEYFDNYITILKTAVSCTIFLAILFSFIEAINTVFPFIYTEAGPYIEFFYIFFPSFFEYAITGSLIIIGFITIIFALIQQHKSKVSSSFNDTWTPSSLKPVPDTKFSIPRNSCIINMAFAVVLSAIIAFSPHLLGTYLLEEDKRIKFIPIFNAEYWSYILPIILFIFLAVFIDNLIQLLIGSYTKPAMYSTILIKTVQVVLSAILLKAIPLFNPEFLTDLSISNNWSNFLKDDVLNRLNAAAISNTLVLIIVISTMIQLVYFISKVRAYEQAK